MNWLPNRQKEAITSFQYEFEQEDFRRERQRAGVLVVLFSLGFVLYGVIIHFFSRSIDDLPGHETTTRSIAIYMGGMLLYEFGIWRMLGTISRYVRGLPYMAKFGNATVEITALTVVLYISSQSFGQPILMLLSPITYLYFVFIVLSTLRLSIAVSLWTGGLAGLEYYLLSRYLLAKSPAGAAHFTEITFFLSSAFPYVVKSIIMLITGGLAAYVARQISLSVQLSIQRMEANEQIRTLFGQQVSPEVVQAILDQNGVLAPRHSKVSIMFLDIRNFTIYADTHSPEDVIAYQSAFFGLVAKVVQEYGGIVNQFLGDGCMITFGAPLALDNPAEQAVKAGLVILQAVEDASRTQLIPPTSIGIGIQSGDAVVGNIGTDNRQQYNITGKVVIQAARIEQLNKEYGSQMLISQDVVNDLPNMPNGTKQLGIVHLKGIAEDIRLWQLA
ncbi:adenylate/guanylate cyclase domain-containing protein [Spirosoma jeollabukense]